MCSGIMLEQRMQWRLTRTAELVEKLCGLVKEQMNEADRALIGVGDVHLRREYADL